MPLRNHNANHGMVYICITCTSDRGLIFRIYEELLQLSDKSNNKISTQDLKRRYTNGC